MGPQLSAFFIILLLGWAVTVLGRLRVARRQAEVWNRVIDKMDAAQLAALLAGESGRTLETMLAGPERPHARIITAAQAGIALLPVGLVLLVYAFAVCGTADAFSSDCTRVSGRVGRSSVRRLLAVK